jgi:hypothetical protein
MESSIDKKYKALEALHELGYINTSTLNDIQRQKQNIKLPDAYSDLSNSVKQDFLQKKTNELEKILNNTIQNIINKNTIVQTIEVDNSEKVQPKESNDDINNRLEKDEFFTIIHNLRRSLSEKEQENIDLTNYNQTLQRKLNENESKQLQYSSNIQNMLEKIKTYEKKIIGNKRKYDIKLQQLTERINQQEELFRSEPFMEEPVIEEPLFRENNEIHIYNQLSEENKQTEILREKIYEQDKNLKLMETELKNLKYLLETTERSNVYMMNRLDLDNAQLQKLRDLRDQLLEEKKQLLKENSNLTSRLAQRRRIDQTNLSILDTNEDEIYSEIDNIMNELNRETAIMRNNNSLLRQNSDEKSLIESTNPSNDIIYELRITELTQQLQEKEVLISEMQKTTQNLSENKIDTTQFNYLQKKVSQLKEENKKLHSKLSSRLQKITEGITQISNFVISKQIFDENDKTIIFTLLNEVKRNLSEDSTYLKFDNKQQIIFDNLNDEKSAKLNDVLKTRADGRPLTTYNELFIYLTEEMLDPNSTLLAPNLPPQEDIKEIEDLQRQLNEKTQSYEEQKKEIERLRHELVVKDDIITLIDNQTEEEKKQQSEKEKLQQIILEQKNDNQTLFNEKQDIENKLAEKEAELLEYLLAITDLEDQLVKNQKKFTQNQKFNRNINRYIDVLKDFKENYDYLKSNIKISKKPLRKLFMSNNNTIKNLILTNYDSDSNNYMDNLNNIRNQIKNLLKINSSLLSLGNIIDTKEQEIKTYDINFYTFINFTQTATKEEPINNDSYISAVKKLMRQENIIYYNYETILNFINVKNILNIKKIHEEKKNEMLINNQKILLVYLNTIYQKDDIYNYSLKNYLNYLFSAKINKNIKPISIPESDTKNSNDLIESKKSIIKQLNNKYNQLINDYVIDQEKNYNYIIAHLNAKMFKHITDDNNNQHIIIELFEYYNLSESKKHVNNSIKILGIILNPQYVFLQENIEPHYNSLYSVYFKIFNLIDGANDRYQTSTGEYDTHGNYYGGDINEQIAKISNDPNLFYMLLISICILLLIIICYLIISDLKIENVSRSIPRTCKQ